MPPLLLPKGPMRVALAWWSAIFLLVGIACADAADAIDAVIQQRKAPAVTGRRLPHSDFPDALGRFMDMLAAGAFNEARALQPAACAGWLATRRDSPLTGKFFVADTEIDLNAMCAGRD